MRLYSFSRLLILCFTGLLASCNMATPERYFDLAVLNGNILSGFAGDGLLRELESPSAKMIPGKSEPGQMTRKEVIDSKLQYLEESVEKLKDLRQTSDTREMVQTAISLDEYVLAAYKKEYLELARLYDEGASKAEIQSLSQTISGKYYRGFEQQMNKLIAIGKVYAEKNEIKVNWGVQTSPR